MITVVVVGQTPPPLGGQAVMIERMLAREYAKTKLVHVRMAFSRELNGAGKFRLAKVVELFRVLTKVIMARLVHRAEVLYYPPAGPNLVPVLRDVFLLSLTRWMFRRTVFHFHAAGLSRIYDTLSLPMRLLFRIAYDKPDVAIRTAERTPQDGKFLHAKREFIIPNGIEDCAAPLLSMKKTINCCVQILYVGVLREDKGLIVLLRACARLHQAGYKFRLVCVGTFESEEFRTTVMECIDKNGLTDVVEFPGVLMGSDKHHVYLASDIFCFPTYFEAESFGIVLLEALSFSLPIVCTNWRGVPEVVDDHCALLVPTKDYSAVADGLRNLIHDPARRRAMGAAGRERFLQQFTADIYYTNLQNVFDYLRADLGCS